MSPIPNPWLPGTEASVLPDGPTMVPATGPTAPQYCVPTPDAADQLPIRRPTRAAALYVLGAHGGAGASMVASFNVNWAPVDAWPSAAAADVSQVVVAARTNARGLCAAKNAARQWASGLVPEVRVVGLILVADAQGRLPKELRDLCRVVGGGYPRTWNLPWIERWRLGQQPDLPTEPREVRRLVDDLRTLLEPGATPTADNRKDRTDGPA